MARLIRDLLSPHRRAVRAAMRVHPGQLFQPAADTWRDRHPHLFAFVAQQLRPVARPSILSFGCSTGEEALTLADRLPEASITAVDLNGRSIRIARRRARREGKAAIRFARRIDLPRDAEAFDAIFCLSVLRHGDLDRLRPECCTTLVSFSRFDEAIAMLDAALKPGGLLCLWGANFRFADASVAGRYLPLLVPGAPAQRGALYGADDRLLPTDKTYQFVFRKLAASTATAPPAPSVRATTGGDVV